MGQHPTASPALWKGVWLCIEDQAGDAPFHKDTGQEGRCSGNGPGSIPDGLMSCVTEEPQSPYLWDGDSAADLTGSSGRLIEERRN